MIHSRLYRKSQIITLGDLSKVQGESTIKVKGMEEEKMKVVMVTLDDLYKGKLKKAEVKGYTRVRRGRMEHVDPFYRHQLAIAKKTLSMTPEMVGVMGGMTIEEAKAFIDKHKEGEKKRAREGRWAREEAYSSLGLKKVKGALGGTYWE